MYKNSHGFVLFSSKISTFQPKEKKISQDFHFQELFRRCHVL